MAKIITPTNASEITTWRKIRATPAEKILVEKSKN